MRLLVFLFCALVAIGAQAQQPQPSKTRRSVDVPSLVLRSDKMQFIVYRPKGSAGNGTLVQEKIVVRDERRDDLLAAAQKLSEGRLVPQGFRTIGLGDPMAECFVGDTSILRIYPFGDRIICSTKENSVDLLFGRKGVQELEDMFDRFKRPNQSLQPTPQSRRG